MAQLVLKFNSDGTCTVRVGRQVEHISVENKEKAELYDAIRWSVISKGVVLSEVKLAELIAEAKQ